MPRYRITVEYDGTPFAGWQLQANGITVQGSLEDAIQKFSGDSVSVRGAGRTDSGVHALGQVAHFDLTKDWDPGRVREALNFHLRPKPVAILDCGAVAPEFDARFSATSRSYLYRILTRRAPPVLERNRVWWLPCELDFDAMRAAAPVLIGKHDFTTFRAAQCQANSPVKTLDRIELTKEGDEIRIETEARSFLHHQVRSMAGSLKLIGEAKWTARDLEDALKARDRTRCGAVAPACGLYLVRVAYGGLDQNAVAKGEDDGPD